MYNLGASTNLTIDANYYQHKLVIIQIDKMYGRRDTYE